MNAKTNTALKDVEEIADELDVAQREVSAVDKRLAERRLKLSQIEEEKARTEAEIAKTAISGDFSALADLTSTAAQLEDARCALADIAIPAIDAERGQANERATAIRTSRRLVELRARIEPECEAVRAQREKFAAAINTAVADLVEYARLNRGFNELREALTWAGPGAPAPAAEPNGREILAALGCGKGQPFRPGFTMIEVPIPASALL